MRWLIHLKLNAAESSKEHTFVQNIASLVEFKSVNNNILT